MACLLFSGCTGPALFVRPMHTVASIKTVVVTKPYESEMGQLPTMDKLPPNSCYATRDAEICSIPPAQVLMWGWGFCENDKATLEANLPSARVALIVEGVRVPDDLIYQRDEAYDQERQVYCHTWSIRLSGWARGKSVWLENRGQAGDLPLQRNVVIMNVTNAK